MQICDKCFNDEEIQTAIHNNNKKRKCDICKQNSFVIDIEYFEDFFIELLQLFKPNNSGKDIVSLLQEDFNIFKSLEIGEKIIDYFINSSNYRFNFNLTDKVSYTEEVLQYIKKWEELKKQLKEVSRFSTDISDFFDGKILKSNTQIRQNTQLFRARINPPDKKGLSKKEMGCPPTSKTPAGRANPIGIPYLYLCENEETTYYEVRALYLDKLTIGNFKVTEDLNILDFTVKISPYSIYSISSSIQEEVSKYKLFQTISKDLSKPLRRYDSELEYVPTQYICEYCKVNGVDGIKFNSSLHEGHKNVVLFNIDKAKCINTKQVEIKTVNIAK